jgi:hypothetical protein
MTMRQEMERYRNVPIRTRQEQDLDARRLYTHQEIASKTRNTTTMNPTIHAPIRKAWDKMGPSSSCRVAA